MSEHLKTKENRLSEVTENESQKKAAESEDFIWSDEAFLEGWNSVYNTEEPKPANFLGRNRHALQMPGAYEKLKNYENSEERLFFEGFYEVDGAITDWEREERMAQVDEALLRRIQH